MANSILDLLIIENPSQVLTLKREVAKSPNIPLHIIEQLKNDSDRNVRLNIFVNPNTPDKILDYLVKEGSTKFGLKPARKTDTPARILDYLKNHPNGTVRLKVAKNPSTPAKTLDYLRNDKSLLVREWVARNSSTPNNILEKIANSPTECSFVSATASRVLEERRAQDENTPSEILAQLAVDNWGKPVTIAVAQNPNTSLETLQELLNHTDEEVTRLAKYNLEQKRKAIQQAKNENTPAAILARLASNKSKTVRQYVASNPNTALEVLEKLSNEFPEEVIANSVFDLLILENASKRHQSFFVSAIMLARVSKTPTKTFIEKMDSTLLIDIGYFT